MEKIKFGEPFELIICPEFGFRQTLQWGQYSKRCHKFITKSLWCNLQKTVAVEALLAKPLYGMSLAEFIRSIEEEGYEFYPLEALMTYALAREPGSDGLRIMALASAINIELDLNMAPCLIWMGGKKLLDLCPVPRNDIGVGPGQDIEYLVGPPLKRALKVNAIPCNFVPPVAKIPFPAVKYGPKKLAA